MGLAACWGLRIDSGRDVAVDDHLGRLNEADEAASAAFGLAAFQLYSVGSCFHKVVAAVLTFLLDTDSL